MNATKVPVAQFEADCVKILHEVAVQGKAVEIIENGKILAVVSPPNSSEASMNDFIGSLKGTVTYQSGWDAPLGPSDWEACR